MLNLKREPGFLGDCTFENCESLEKINIPKGKKAIGDGVLRNVHH